MKPLKTLGATLALTLVIAVAAFAGETNSPPCAEPGQTNTPPCAAQSVSGDSETPGQTSTPPAANAGSEFSFTNLALDVIESALLLF